MTAANTFLVFFTLLLSGPALENAPQGMAQAKTRKIRSAERRAAVKATVDFTACRKQSLKRWRKNKNRKSLKTGLAICEEKYPAASKYLECKKKTSKLLRGSKQKLDAALKRCGQILVRAQFDQKSVQPYHRLDDLHLFAGVGMNRPVPIKRWSPPTSIARPPKSPSKARLRQISTF